MGDEFAPPCPPDPVAAAARAAWATALLHADAELAAAGWHQVAVDRPLPAGPAWSRQRRGRRVRRGGLASSAAAVRFVIRILRMIKKCCKFIQCSFAALLSDSGDVSDFCEKISLLWCVFQLRMSGFSGILLSRQGDEARRNWRSQMEPSANNYRSALHDGLPDGPLTSRQRALVDAVRDDPYGLADFSAVSAETVITVEVIRVSAATPEAVAADLARRGIAVARAKLDQLEGVLAAYGGAAFVSQPEPVSLRGVTGETLHEVIVSVLRLVSSTNRVLVRAGRRRVSRDESGAYVVVVSDN